VIIGKRSISSILRSLGVLNKQKPDLTTEGGFLEWVVALALDLKLSNDAAIAEEVAKIRPFLEANWPKLSPDQIKTNLAELSLVISKIRKKALDFQEPILELAADDAFKEGGADFAKRFNLVTPAFLGKDKVANAFLVGSTMNFLRGRDGRILNDFTTKARGIVANSLDLGLGRVDIGELLEKAFGDVQSTSYYTMVAGQFLNRARSYSALRSMEEAKIEFAEIAAILDGRTTDVCRFLDGQYIEVGRSLDLIDNISRKKPNVNTVKDDNPWIRQGRDEDGNFLFVEKSNKKRTIVARIVRSGVGELDDRGEFSGGMDSNQLQTLGIGPPPYHGYCLDGESLVLTSLGLVPIKNVDVGDLVFTHKGRWRKVIGTSVRNFHGMMIRIVNDGFVTLATQNHPFLSGWDWVTAESLLEKQHAQVIPNSFGLSDLREEVQSLCLSCIDKVLFEKVSKCSESKSKFGVAQDAWKSSYPSGSKNLQELWQNISDTRTSRPSWKREVLFKRLSLFGTNDKNRERMQNLWGSILGPSFFDKKALFLSEWDLLLHGLSESRANTGAFRELQREDAREEQSNVRAFSDTSRHCGVCQARFYDHQDEKHLRSEIREDLCRDWDGVSIRARAFPSQGQTNLRSGLPHSETGSLDRSEGLVQRQGQKEAELFHGEPWPDSPCREGCSEEIRTVRLDRVERVFYRNIDVFNLEIQFDESYIVGGLVSHNCRTTLLPVLQ